MLNYKTIVYFYSALIIVSFITLYYQEQNIYFLSPLYIGKISIWYQWSIGFLVAIIFLVLWAILKPLFAWLQNLEEIISTALGKYPLRQIVVIALLSGIGEEIFFRGVLQPSIGIESASILFGILHCLPCKEGIYYSLVATLMGFIFGYLALYCGGIMAPTLAHILINMVNIYRITRITDNKDC